MEQYPWDLDLAESRGWPREAHRIALTTGNEDLIGLTHPTNWLTEDEVENPTVSNKCILCYMPAPEDGPDIDGKRAHVECFLNHLADNLPHQSSGGYGPHDWSCPACIAESMRRTEYRLNNNPHRPGTKVAARWDRDRSSVDWAMDMRGETYWSM